MRPEIQSPIPDSFAADTPAIELVTENGFSIRRAWEIEGVPPPIAGSYPFLVRNPQSVERPIDVEIIDAIVAQIELSTWGRIRQGNSFWICCAERHLAIYVWEKGDYPQDDRLRVSRLDPDDLMTSIRWQIA
jgi:hypothetical protein